jgi:hypothetical protein
VPTVQEGTVIVAGMGYLDAARPDYLHAYS